MNRTALATLSLTAALHLGCSNSGPSSETDATVTDTGAVTDAGTDVPATTDRPDVQVTVDVPTIDTPAADVPTTDVPVVDVPDVIDVVDVPAVDIPIIDVSVADVPPPDVPPPDVPPLDVPPPDPDLYASPDGAGAACTRAAPCALTTARDQARLRNRDLHDDLHVWLSGGTYALTTTFELTADDSGSNGHRVVYEALPGASPVLSGGCTLPHAWTLHDPARNVYRIALDPGVRSRQLYVDGRRATRARGPTLPPGFVETATGYTAPDATMASWSHPGAIEVVGFHAWKSFRCGVASISGRDVTMRQPCWANAQSHTGYTLDLPQWIENAPELLDEPGEFFLDEAAHQLLYLPHDDEDLARATVVVPTVETLVRARGTLDAPLHHLTFRNVTFAYATWMQPSTDEGYAVLQSGVVGIGTPMRQIKTPATVAFTAAHDVTLEDCAFEHLGGAGVSFDDGSQDDLVVGGRFEDLSGSAVSIGNVTRETDHHPTDPRDVVRNVTLRDSFITRAGAEYFDAPGVFVGYTDGTVVDHNDLFDLPYTGVTVGWGWGGVDPLAGVYATPTICRNNAVTNNVISHPVRRLEDGGGIYVLGAQPGAVMRGNWINNQGNPYGSLYLDNGTQFFTVTSNLVTASPYWLYVQVYAPIARNNIVTGNLSDADTWFRPQPVDASNLVHDNTVFSGAWPAAAQTVASAAGLEGRRRAVHPADGAVRHPTRASSTYDTGHTAGLAADGDMRTGWSPAGTDASPWWQVDLGASADVRGVEVVTRWELDQPVTRRNFAVWLSDDPEFATHVVFGAQGSSTLPHRAIWSRRLAPSAPANRYRYVRVVKTRGEYFFLGDVRVLTLP